MKSSEAKRKEPATQAPKASRGTRPGAAPRKEAARAAEAPRVEPPRPAAAEGSLPMPDLTKYGVTERDARAHVVHCEPCGRAHRHVVKNPRDAMALDAFGRHIATCLAVHGEKAPA
jgi:hypothetical protein